MTEIPFNIVKIPVDTAWTPVATVPAGMTMTVRGVAFQNLESTATPMRIAASRYSGDVYVRFFDQVVPATSSTTWAGSLVLSPGYMLLVYADLANTRMWISGVATPITATLADVLHIVGELQQEPEEIAVADR